MRVLQNPEPLKIEGSQIKEALAMIRSQIRYGRKSMLEAYAEIVFRAWKIGNRGSREEIENEFLQGLVESAIHASSVPFVASIRKVLGGLISQRTTDGVEKLLFRLAEPVIFRSLQVANSNVRQNTLHLLLDLFPLEDPDATKEGKDILLRNSFFYWRNCSQMNVQSGVLEIAFFSLKVISEVSIVQSKQCDYVNTSPVLAYAALALHISFKAVTFNGIDNQGTKAKECSGRSSSEQTLLDQTMDHLFSCTSKLIGVADSTKFNKLHQESRHTNYRIHHGGQKHKEFQAEDSSPSDSGRLLLRPVLQYWVSNFRATFTEDKG